MMALLGWMKAIGVRYFANCHVRQYQIKFNNIKAITDRDMVRTKDKESLEGFGVPMIRARIKKIKEVFQ